MTIDILKEATADHHTRAENSPAMTLLMSDRLSATAYGNILAAIWRFIDGFETTLLRQAPEMSARFSYSERVKSPLLLEDLAFLKHELPSATSAARVVTGRLEQHERALGAMYVIEGATLGGKYVSEHVSRVLGFERPNGVSYFYSYGDRRGSMWNSFRREADNVISEKGLDLQRIIDAAIETFESYSEAMHGA